MQIAPTSSIIFMLKDSKLCNNFVLPITVRKNAAAAMQLRYALGVKRMVMLTGSDSENVAASVAKTGLPDIMCAILPEDKSVIC